MPTEVGSGWSSVAAGDGFTVAIRTDGSLWSWGSNYAGQLGQGDNRQRSVPTQVGSASWHGVTAGTGFALAIRSDGTLWAWGDNSSGQLGVGDTASRNAPAEVGHRTGWQVIAAGGTHTVGLAV